MQDNMTICVHLRIRGDVGAADFPPWILRHVRRLGLSGTVLSQTVDRVEVSASGPAELVEALALGCSLGPHSVLVEAVEYLPNDLARMRDRASHAD